jgi:stage II sporulation protein AA (anti-sigma F factor antagonist)
MRRENQCRAFTLTPKDYHAGHFLGAARGRSSTKMELKTKKDGKKLYIFLNGELDEYAASVIRPKLDVLIETENMLEVVYDLSALTFADSTGIGLLIGRYKKLKARNISVYIKNVSPHIEKIFKMTGLFEIMPKIDDLQKERSK